MNKNINKVNIDVVLNPKDGAEVQVCDNCWWVVTKENEVLFYREYSPQCNSNYEIAKKLQEKMYPDCELRLLARAFVPISQYH